MAGLTDCAEAVRILPAASSEKRIFFMPITSPLRDKELLMHKADWNLQPGVRKR